jgi:hypothetical protein
MVAFWSPSVEFAKKPTIVRRDGEPLDEQAQPG